MKKLFLILFSLSFLCSIAFADCTVVVGQTVASVGGCAGGDDGYIGRTDAGGFTTNCAGTCTTNYLVYSAFVVETDANQEDGTITYGHWDTQYAAASTRAGIWNSDGELVVGTAEQEGADGNTDPFNVSITETCLAAGTYYAGVWIEGDAWANAETTGYVGGAVRYVVEMATFGNMCGTPTSCGSSTANQSAVVWFDNNSGRP